MLCFTLGFDEISHTGPGSGKTILGLQFLNRAVRQGESALLITFGQSEGELRPNVGQFGFAMDKIRILDLSPDSTRFARGEDYDILGPAPPPLRVFVDGMTQLRYLTSSNFHFRNEALAFLRFLSELGSTVLFSSESNEAPDEDLQFIADAVIHLEFSGGHRSVSILKFRGSDFRPGSHTLRLGSRGMEVFPRLMPEEFNMNFKPDQIPFGLPEMDALVSGGLERGTITILTGPSGVGKSSLGMQFVTAAAARGERAVVYLFEEQREAPHPPL